MDQKFELKFKIKTRILFSLFALFFLSSCKIDQGRIDVTFKKSNTAKLSNVTIASVQFNNHQLIITGTNLNSVTQINMQNLNLGFAKAFSIESKSATQIIANGNSAISFATSAIFDLILSNASAAATYTVDFSLCNALLGGKQIDCSITPSNNYVLSYDGASNKWKPKAITGLTYAGAHDASGGVAPTAQPAGTYYIISVAGTISAVSFNVGDWIVSNGSGYQKVPNPGGVASVFGRSGAVVATEGDYDLDKLSDVDLTTPATNGQVLKYDGTKWVAAADDSFGGAGSVNSTTITDGSITGTDIANDTITLAKLNGTSDATKYLRGDKTWATFLTDVLNVPLTGYALDSGTKPTVSATDKIPAAFGKIQKFLNDLNTDYVSKSTASQTITGSWSFTNPTSFLYTQTPTGATATEVTNVSYVQNYVDNAFASGGAYAPATLTTVNGAHTLSDTTLTVASTSGYPTTGTLLIGSEIIPYTGKTATTFTGLTRGGFGSTAAAISNSATVNNFLLMARSTTTTTPKFVITGDGNVGIGTARPNYMLDVVGGFFHTGYNSVSIPPSDNTNGGLIVGWNRLAGGGQAEVNFYNAYEFGPSSAPAFLFSQKTGTSTVSDLMSINRNGNVGIGTSSPSALLEIVGTATSSASALPNVLTIIGANNSGGGQAAGISITTGKRGCCTTGASFTMGGGAYAGGGAITLAAGLNGGGGPGAINIIGAGAVGSSDQTGGPVNITGGNAGATYNGGAINITAGGGGSSNGNGANVIVDGGAKGGSGLDGNVLIASNRGNVGIGTSSPQAIFHVNKTETRSTGYVPTNRTDLTINPTSSSNSIYNGVSSLVSAESANNLTGTVSAIYGFVENQDQSGTINELISGEFELIAQGSGAVTNVNGVKVTTFRQGAATTHKGIDVRAYQHTGNLTDLIGISLDTQRQAGGSQTNIYGIKNYVDSGGTVTNMYGEHISMTNWGTVTNVYGIYLGSFGFGTNTFGIYQSGSGDKNYFAGNVGIGTTPSSYKLDVNGDTNIASGSALRFGGTQVCTSAGCTSSSDERLKENIQPLEGSLEKILQLKGVEYDYKDKSKFGDKHQIGVIAQDIEKVFPEVVITDKQTGLKSVAYDHLIAPVVEAIKELFVEIFGLKEAQKVQELRLKKMEIENQELKMRLEKLEKKILATHK